MIFTVLLFTTEILIALESGLGLHWLRRLTLVNPLDLLKTLMVMQVCSMLGCWLPKVLFG